MNKFASTHLQDGTLARRTRRTFNVSQPSSYWAQGHEGQDKSFTEGQSWRRNDSKKRKGSQDEQDDNWGGDREQKKARHHQEDRPPRPKPRKQSRPRASHSMSQPPLLFGASPMANTAAQATFANPFGTPIGTAPPSTTPSFNPFAPKPQPPADSSTNFTTNAFETKKPIYNPFAPAPSNSASSNTVEKRPADSFKSFGAPSQPTIPSTIPKQLSTAAKNSQTKQFGMPFGMKFGSPSVPSTSPFGAPPKQAAFQTQNGLPKSKLRFAEVLEASQSPNTSQTGIKKSASSTFTNGTSSPVPISERATSEVMKQRVEAALKSKGLKKPSMPKVGVNTDRAAWELFTKDMRAYREQYKKILMDANILDDPDVRKPLEDAYDFKGTCTAMCPELEAAERMVEHRYDQFEKDYLGEGSFSAEPNFNRMVKKFGRSAAGQDERLPMEVRTVNTLAKTLDYLVDDLIPTFELPKVHEFIWDRTRGIRRDLVYPTFFTDHEMHQRIKIFENIARFHVVSLHQMSKETAKPASYNAYQEKEQLNKTLMSLRESYEECMDRQLQCKNRAEFLAYSVLLQCEETAILQKAQDWGMALWGKSHVFQTAVSLVEAYQNISDTHGPLENPATRGRTPLDTALCAFTKFFTIVEDSSVSYQMACFAEMHFNGIRMSIVRSILHAYRRQKDQTKDWTLSRLNAYLRFDDESEIVPWGEMHGLHFELGEEEEYLSFSSSSLHKASPEAPQQFSSALVESKRGDHSLSELVRTTVFVASEEDEYGPIAEDETEDGTAAEEEEEEEEDELLVRDNNTEPGSQSVFQPGFLLEEGDESNNPQELGQESTNPASTGASSFSAVISTPQDPPNPNSIFGNFGSLKTASFPTSQDTIKAKENPPSIFSQPIANTNSEIATHMQQQLPAASSKPLFGFLTQPSPLSQPVVNNAKPLFGLSSVPSTTGPESVVSNAKPLFGFSSGSNTTTAPEPAVNKENPLLNFSSGSTPIAPEPVLSKPKPLFSFSSGSTATTTIAPESAVNGAKPLDIPATTTILKSQAPATNYQATPAKKVSFAPSADNASTMKSPVQNPLFTNGAQLNTTSPTSIATAPPGGNSSAFQSLMKAPEPAPSNKPSKILSIANWVALGEGGLMEQFTEFVAESLLRDTAELFMAEQKQLEDQKAAEACRLEADRFRYRTLAARYFSRWREAARKAGLKRRGREARKRRREIATAMAAEKANIVEDFRASARQHQEEEETDCLEEFQNSASTSRRLSRERRESLESLLQDPALQALIQEKVEQELDRRESSSKKRPRSEQSSDHVASGSRHKRDRSDNPLGRSLLSDATYLSGGSRMHLISSYNAQVEDRHDTSGVETDYFRLKARGISSIPDGRRSTRKDVVHKKHKFDGITKSSRSKVQAWARSPTPEATVKSRASQLSVEYEKHRRSTNGFEDLPSKGKSKQIDALDDFDRELFARCKQSRDALGEGEEYRDISEELLEAERRRVQTEKEGLKRQEDKVQAEMSRIQSEKKRLKRKSRSLS